MKEREQIPKPLTNGERECRDSCVTGYLYCLKGEEKKEKEKEKEEEEDFSFLFICVISSSQRAIPVRRH
jgi:hypothetical protein